MAVPAWQTPVVGYWLQRRLLYPFFQCPCCLPCRVTCGHNLSAEQPLWCRLVLQHCKVRCAVWCIYWCYVMTCAELEHSIKLMYLTSRKCLATSTPMTPAEQPMPARLWDRISERILKWLTHIDANDGVGEKQEQTTMSMSICSDTQYILSSQGMALPA